jgi:LysM repeat protein
MIVSPVTSLAVEETSTFHVTPLTLGENEVFVYYPANSLADTFIVKLSCTAPTFIVYGDAKQYNNTTAAEFIEELGFDKLAAETGSVIVLVSPINAGGWTEKDIASYGTIAGTLTDNSLAVSSYGITKSLSFMTQEEETKIIGNANNIHLFGVGEGADFVGKYLLTSQAVKMTFPDGNSISFDYTPSSITLVGASQKAVLNETANPNSDKLKTRIRSAAINCDDSQLNALSVLGSDYKAVTGEDVRKTIYETYNSFNKIYRRQVGVLIPIHDFEALGIVEKVETYIAKKSSDNITIQTDTYPINYVTYYPKELDVNSGKMPLILLFHGGGNTALYTAQATEWPLIAKENGLIVVSVDLHHPNTTATETIDLIKHLQKEYPAIDPSRIYANGFSMGGVKCWDLFEQYPEVFAGLAPMSASFEVGVDSFNNPVENINTDVAVPVFYVGGEASPLPELPFQEKRVINRISWTFKVNDVVADYTDPDFSVNNLWGINGDKIYTVEDTQYFKDSVLTVNLFKSSDGNYYTALANSSNQSHEIYARNSWAIWDFLKQFSRNTDGTISINENQQPNIPEEPIVPDKPDVPDETATSEETNYRTYTVVKGDCLWVIARKYLGSGFRYKEIMELNGLKSDIIHPNQVLRLPHK